MRFFDKLIYTIAALRHGHVNLKQTIQVYVCNGASAQLEEVNEEPNRSIDLISSKRFYGTRIESFRPILIFRCAVFFDVQWCQSLYQVGVSLVRVLHYRWFLYQMLQVALE
jgi:hypothetical protein